MDFIASISTKELVLVCVIALLSLYLWLRSRRGSLRLPPRPFSLPFLGPINGNDSERPRLWARWARELHSDVVSIRFFPLPFPIVTLNSYESIRDAFAGPDTAEALAGRPRSKLGEIANPGYFGLILSEGRLWKEQRRWALHALRDLGFGKHSIEQVIRDELGDLVAQLRSLDGRAVDPSLPLVRGVTNVICALVFGDRLGGDPKIERFSHLIASELLRNSRLHPLAFAFGKAVFWIPGDPFGVKRFMKAQQEVLEFLEVQLKEHERTYDASVARDYIDAFLSEMKKNEGNGESTFTYNQLLRSLFDFFVAGLETTSTFLRWAMLLMAHHRDIQRRVRAEILEHVGRERPPQMSDRPALRYTEAVLCEIHRFTSIAGSSVPHRAMQTVKVHGYDIPEDSIVFSNLFAVHHEPKIWPAPERFDPDVNFLSAAGELVRTEYLIPFGVGKRVCLGESLARQELFIFFTGLLQHFEVAPYEQSALPPENESVWLDIRHPKPFVVCFQAL